GILRRDGSSKFGPNSRWGWFPTLSGSWLLSEEDFYHSKTIRSAKLRMSYGVSGNDQIANFAYRGLLNGEGVYVFNDIIVSGVAIGRASNPDLKWESTHQFNLGTDLTIGRQVDLTLNYFIKNTRDLLFQPDVSGILGTAGAGSYPPIINAGDVSNKGVELEMQYRFIPRRDWNLSMGLNAAYLKNEVKSTPEGVDFIPGAGFGVGGNVATRFEMGFPIGYFVG
ncbi:MAG: TonB-dependent receptor domain-containing protein, partial [Bacteroidia bacterium]